MYRKIVMTGTEVRRVSKMKEQKKYSREYKEEALKLVEEKGCKKASEELEISYNHCTGG